MADLPLSLACWSYDRTRPLIDGVVKPEGIALDVKVMRPREAFDRMLATGEFHISEMSLSSLVTMKAETNCPLVAIPVTLSKMFRHDCVYVRRDAGIKTPRDLRGRRVGTMRYTSTALVFARGLLQHDFGVSARDIKWHIGGINHPMRASRPPHTPEDVEMTILSDGRTLDAMLAAGEIDAMITQDIPDSFLRREPHIARLFPDFKTVEIEYFKRTGIFPAMHTIAIREEVYRAHPWIARSIYGAFVQAKDIALHGLYDTDALHLSLPFLIDHIEEARRVFGDDFFSYGLEENRQTLSALCQYVFEQNLSSRLVAPDELFVGVA